MNDNYHIALNKNADRLKNLACLPANCGESADRLEHARSVYESRGVFPPSTINGIIRRLRAYHDADLLQSAKADNHLMRQLVDRYFYCG